MGGFLFAAICAAISLVGCSPSDDLQEATIVQRETERVQFQGPITAEAVADARNILREGDVLLIYSRGGDTKATLDLLSLIRERNVRLRVNGACYAVCALALALPFQDVSLNEGSTLLFDAASARVASRDTDSLTAAGLDVAILRCIQNAAGAGGSKVRPSRWVWLSPDVLKAFGAGQFVSQWSLEPTARDDFEGMIAPDVDWVDDPSQCA